jgi:hypothetical protein
MKNQHRITSDKMLASSVRALIVLMLIVYATPVAAGDPLSFIGNWNYRKSGGDTGDSSLFNHTYTLIYSKELSDAMAFSASVRYNENIPSGDLEKTDSINPTLSLDTRNDFFSLNLNASRTELNREDNPSRTDQSWSANFQTQVEQWPSLRLYYNQNSSYDDGSPRRQDVDSDVFGATIEYTIAHFDLLYDFRRSESQDHVNRSDTETTDHTAQVGYSNSFFGNRVSVAASQQYQSFKTSTETRVGVGGRFFVPAFLFGGFSSEDDTPATGTPANNPALVDGDTDASAGIDITGTTIKQNMAVQADLQPIDRVRVYLDRIIDTATQNRLQWSIYQSSDLTNWTQITNILPVFYDEENSRTLVVLDLVDAAESRYIKVVSDTTLPSAISVFVTEMEAGTVRTATSDRFSINQRTINLQSQFSTTVRITDSWQVSYNLRRNENRPDNGLDTVQFNHTLSTRYNPSELLTLSLGISENIDWTDSDEDRRSRSYFISVGSQPLPTLNYTLGYTRTETRSDEHGDIDGDSFSALVNATIFPDLTSSLSANWSQREDITDGRTNTVYGFNLDATARLSPRLDLNIDLGYTKSTSEDELIDDETTTGTRYGFNLGYRPSDILLFNGGFHRQVEENTSVVNASFTGLWTRKLQTIFGLTYSMGDEDSRQYTGTISWLVSRRISTQINGSYLDADSGDSWSILSSLHLTL